MSECPECGNIRRHRDGCLYGALEAQRDEARAEESKLRRDLKTLGKNLKETATQRDEAVTALRAIQRLTKGVELGLFRLVYEAVTRTLAEIDPEGDAES